MSNNDPAAGWYPDPDDATQQRYWDGSQWTEHRAKAMAVNYEQAAEIRGKSRKRAFIVIGAVAGVVALVAIGSSLTSESGSSAPTAADTPSRDAASGAPAERAKFKGRLTSAKFVDPATVQVFVSVENTGEVAGYASCFVSVSNRNGTYEGFDTFDLPDEIKPGKFDGFNAYLTVTNEGAAFVTEHSIDCEEQ